MTSDALAPLPLAGEDHRLQGAHRTRLGLPPHQLQLGVGEVVEPEVGEQPRARQRRVARPGLVGGLGGDCRPVAPPACRCSRARAFCGRSRWCPPGDLAVDLLRALVLAQRREGARRPVPAAPAARVVGVEREELGPGADGAAVVPFAVLPPARCPEVGRAGGVGRDRCGGGGAGSRPARRRGRRPPGSRRRASCRALMASSRSPRSPSCATFWSDCWESCASAAARRRAGCSGRARRWRRRRRPGRAPMRAPRPAAPVGPPRSEQR